MLVALTLTFAALVAVVIAVKAWRGRRIDDHPICRGCGYDLHESAGETCPECGADVTKPHAVRIGNRRRRPALLAASVALLLTSLAGGGVVLYVAVTGLDWIQYKPFPWTLRDAAARAGRVNEPNVMELQRRLTTGTLTSAQMDKLSLAALDVQGDRAIAWPYHWGDVLDHLLAQAVLSPAQVARCLEQGLNIDFKIRPVIRLGRTVALDLDASFDRMSPYAQFKARFHADAVTLGGVELVPAGAFNNDTDDQAISWFSSGYRAVIDLDQRRFAALREGPCTMDTTLTYELELMQPAAYAPITLRLPVSIPVKIVGHDAIVDTFVTDPSWQRAMEAAWTGTRVETEGDELKIWIHLVKPPAAMSMSVWLTQGDEAWHVGGLRFDAGEDVGWVCVRSEVARHPTAGEVGVELRPDQAAADTALEPDTYWGEPMTRAGIIVGAPYAPTFNMDASHTTAMEQAITVSKVCIRQSRFGPRLNASIWARGAPVRISYHIRIRTGGAWSDLDPDFLFEGDADSNFGFNSGDFPLPDPDATVADILLVPNLDWEHHSDDPTPPWGYPILFEHVPLPRKSQGETPVDKVHGRALLDTLP